MDLKVFSKPDDLGFRYVLVMVDYFTRSVMLRALVTKESEEVLEQMMSVFFLVGFPDTLVSDGAKEFDSKAFQALMDMGNFNQIITHRYLPRENGMTERRMQMINQRMRMLSDEQKSKWSEHLPRIQFDINTSWCSAIGMTPSEALFGFLPNGLGVLKMTLEDKRAVEAFQRAREELRSVASQNIAKAKRLMEKGYNQRHRTKKVRFNSGDKVLLKKRKPGKMDLPFTGPWVVKFHDKGRNIVELEEKGEVHVERLKLFRSPEEVSRSNEATQDESEAVIPKEKSELEENDSVEEHTERKISQAHREAIKNVLRWDLQRRSRRSPADMADFKTTSPDICKEIVGHEVDDHGRLFYLVLLSTKGWEGRPQRLAATLSRGNAMTGTLLKEYWTKEQSFLDVLNLQSGESESKQMVASGLGGMSK
jgi:hypothetical protein